MHRPDTLINKKRIKVMGKLYINSFYLASKNPALRKGRGFSYIIFWL